MFSMHTSILPVLRVPVCCVLSELHAAVLSYLASVANVNWFGSLTVSCRRSSMRLRRIIVLGAKLSMFSFDKIWSKVHNGDAELDQPMCRQKPASPMS